MFSQKFRPFDYQTLSHQVILQKLKYWQTNKKNQQQFSMMAGKTRKPNTLRILVLKKNFRQVKRKLAIEEPDEFRRQLLEHKNEELKAIENQRHPRKRFKSLSENKPSPVVAEEMSSSLSVINFVKSSQQLLKDLNDSITSTDSARVPCFKQIFSFIARKFTSNIWVRERAERSYSNFINSICTLWEMFLKLFWNILISI